MFSLLIFSSILCFFFVKKIYVCKYVHWWTYCITMMMMFSAFVTRIFSLCIQVPTILCIHSLIVFNRLLYGIVCRIMKTTVGKFSWWPSFHASQRPLRGRHRDNENDWILVQCNINTHTPISKLCLLFYYYCSSSIYSWVGSMMNFLGYGNFNILF